MVVDKYLVSIIVPVYNVEKYITQCITSILAQTYQKFELILVDDGSRDKSGEICDSFAEKDKRIHVYHNSNHGVSASRNFGIDHANGSRICFVDSDDWVDETYLSDMLKYADYDFVIQGMKQNGKESRYKTEKILSNLQLFDIYISIALKHDALFNAPCSKLLKTEIIRENNVRFNEKISLGEDLMFNLTYMCYIKNSYIVDTCSYNYRITEGSLTHVHVPIGKMLNKANTIKEIITDISKRVQIKQVYDVVISSQIEELLRRVYRHKSSKGERQIAFAYFKSNGNSRNLKYMRMPYSKFKIFLSLPFRFADPILLLLFKVLSKVKPAQSYS